MSDDEDDGKYYDEVEIEDMDYNNETMTWTYPCPCAITREEIAH